MITITGIVMIGCLFVWGCFRDLKREFKELRDSIKEVRNNDR